MVVEEVQPVNALVGINFLKKNIKRSYKNTKISKTIKSNFHNFLCIKFIK